MLVSRLFSQIPQVNIAFVYLADKNSEVYSLETLDDNTHPHHPEVLYFGSSDYIPSHTDSASHLTYVLTDGAVPDATLHNINVLCLSPQADANACLKALKDALLEDQRQIGVSQRILTAHLSDRGLQYVVSESAEALGHPVVVVDTNSRYIAHHLGALEGMETPLARSLEDELSRGSLDDHVSDYIVAQHIDSEIVRNQGLLERYNQILGDNTLTTAVFVNGVCIAHVMAIECGRPFTELDRTIMRQLGLFVGQELQKSTVYAASSGELGSFFLVSILNADNVSEALAKRRLRELNFHPKPVLYVVVLHSKGQGLDQLQVEHVASSLRGMLHHSLYARYHQQLVAVVSRDEEDDLASSLELLHEIAALNDLTVGISNPYQSLSNSRIAYQQARRAVTYGNRGQAGVSDNLIYRYRDYAPARMMELAGRRTDLLRLCHPALQTLRAYDSKHSGELMDTLFCYLQCAGSVKRAARLMHLHKNTMLYRVDRIRTLLEGAVDLASGEDRFLLQTSFRLLIYLGAFEPKVLPTRDELHL